MWPLTSAAGTSSPVPVDVDLCDVQLALPALPQLVTAGQAERVVVEPRSRYFRNTPPLLADAPLGGRDVGSAHRGDADVCPVWCACLHHNLGAGGACARGRDLLHASLSVFEGALAVVHRSSNAKPPASHGPIVVEGPHTKLWSSTRIGEAPEKAVGETVNQWD